MPAQADNPARTSALRIGAIDRVFIYHDGSVTDEKGEWLGNIHHEI
jgi:hypothetical protein